MTDLGFPPKGPTVTCCDNQLAINVVNARVPTECSCHIDIQHFAIQDWKESGEIVMEFISGVINPTPWLGVTRPTCPPHHGALLTRVLLLFDLLKTSTCVRSITYFYG